jgi:hypothetical protein
LHNAKVRNSSLKMMFRKLQDIFAFFYLLNF